MCLMAALIWQQRTTKKLKQTLARVSALQGELAAAGEETRQGRQRELEQRNNLNLARAETTHLRGELGRLRREFAPSEEDLVAEPPAAQKALGPGQAADKVLVNYVANVETALGPGESAITGGWETQPGKRVLVVVTPEMAAGRAGPDSPAQILIQTKLIEMPESVFEEMDLGGLSSDGNESSSLETLSKEEVDSLLEELAQTPGVRILTPAKVRTPDGSQTEVTVTNLPMAAGMSETAVPTLTLTPKLTGAGPTFDLRIAARLPVAVSRR